jgi:hypothetical protein
MNYILDECIQWIFKGQFNIEYPVMYNLFCFNVLKCLVAETYLG